MTAFSRAVSAGYRYVETDVHATADGVLVAFHDSTLDRVTDSSGKIAELPWSVVSQARVDGVERIPLLEDLLGTWPQLRINIDVKAEPAIEPLAEVLRHTGSVSRVCVASFSDQRLAAVRRAIGPDLCTSLGQRAVIGMRAASWLRWPWLRLGAPCVQVPVRHGRVTVVDRAFVTYAHRRGLQVHVWTIDDEAEMNRLLDLGIDGIMTDRIDVLRAVYQSRGLWAA